jgi:hypothetical protein
MTEKNHIRTYVGKPQLLTNVDGLDPDAFLDVGVFGIVSNSGNQDLRFAQGVDKGRTPRARGTFIQ